MLKEDETFLETYSIKITKKIKDQTRFLTDFAAAIKIQSKRVNEDEDMFEPEDENALVIKGSIFTVINFNGDSFGEQSLLHDKPRMATVYVISETASLAMLSKRNYKKVLGAIYKATIDLFISKIR